MFAARVDATAAAVWASSCETEARSAGVKRGGRARFSTRSVSAMGAAMAKVERRVKRVRVWVLGKSMLGGR